MGSRVEYKYVQVLPWQFGGRIEETTESEIQDRRFPGWDSKLEVPNTKQECTVMFGNSVP
jgi:hypothetical protein